MSDKHCHACGRHPLIVKTGCLLALSEKYENGEREVITGDLFWCESCERFQLFGANRVHRSDREPHALATGFVIEEENNGWCTVHGHIVATAQLVEFMCKWYPNLVRTVLAKKLYEGGDEGC